MSSSLHSLRGRPVSERGAVPWDPALDAALIAMGAGGFVLMYSLSPVLGVEYGLVLGMAFVMVYVLRRLFVKFRRRFMDVLEIQFRKKLIARIHLVSNPDVAWRHQSEVRALAEPLLELGFKDAGTFEMAELPGDPMWGLVHYEDAITATIADGPSSPLLRLATRYEDGSGVVYMNGLPALTRPEAPDHTFVYSPGTSAIELYRRFLAERPRKPALHRTPEEFVQRSEDAYAQYQDWLTARGGYTLDELREGLRATPAGAKFSEIVIRAMHQVQAKIARERIAPMLRERFLAQGSLTPEEWHERADRLLVVHDALTADEVVALVQPFAAERIKLPRDLKESRDPHAVAAALVERLPLDRRPHKLAELDRPVHAELYVAPR